MVVNGSRRSWTAATTWLVEPCASVAIPGGGCSLLLILPAIDLLVAAGGVVYRSGGRAAAGWAGG
jgi:hypothetical protein